MGRQTRFSIAKKDIVTLFEALPNKALSLKNIKDILEQNREFWRLAKSMKVEEFLNEMLSKTKLKEVKLDFNGVIQSMYIYDQANAYQVALSLKPKTYLSHYTAVYFHTLTEQLPKAIYSTFEQSAKDSKPVSLTQPGIDSAFAKQQRISANSTTYDSYSLYLLNGKRTDNEGVISGDSEHMGKVRVTSLERTLIDIAVRPAYSGGIAEVLKAYERAKETVSVNKLNAMLKKLKFIYPYHQAIGFYMEKAGYREAQLNLMKAQAFEFDFYLTYGMQDKVYDPTWKLYYPKGF
jgi:predicted transcriptional regulator of viral defense system